MLAQVYLYTDGACRGNPGPGGYAAILHCGDRERELAGGSDQTTNNRMELTAVLVGLQALKGPCRLTVVTDSQYVAAILNGAKAKSNLDLVQEVHRLAVEYEVVVEQVAAHRGHPLNERADKLAGAEAARRLAGRPQWLPGQPTVAQVVNFKAYGSIARLDEAFGQRWLYIGRHNPAAGLAQSPLANPFKARVRGRGETLERYRAWLWQRIQVGDTAVLNALRAIDSETVLVCYCHPAPCHGDVVLAAANWLQRQERGES
jgi:ribonuclease HI